MSFSSLAQRAGGDVVRLLDHGRDADDLRPVDTSTKNSSDAAMAPVTLMKLLVAIRSPLLCLRRAVLQQRVERHHVEAAEEADDDEGDDQGRRSCSMSSGGDEQWRAIMPTQPSGTRPSSILPPER